MTFKDRNSPKKKAHRDKKCFNYYKLDHFGHDYYQPNKKLAKIGSPSLKRRINNRSRSQISH